MNPQPETIGQRRIAREDCEIGDWVDANLIPEWSAQLTSHIFRRRRVSISPATGDMGGILPDNFEEWIFVADHRGDAPVWLRES